MMIQLQGLLSTITFLDVIDIVRRCPIFFTVCS